MVTVVGATLTHVILRNCVRLRHIGCLFRLCPHLRYIDLSGCSQVAEDDDLLHAVHWNAGSSAAQDQTNAEQRPTSTDDIEASKPNVELQTRPMLGSASHLVLPGHMHTFGGKVTANRSNLRLMYNDNVHEERTIIECDYSDYKF